MDPLLLTILTAVGVWPLWAAARSTGLGAWRGTLVLVAVAITMATLLVAVGTAGPGAGAPSDRPIEVGGEDPSFASSGACRSCHPREDATWRASFHRRMSQHATPQRVVPAIGSIEFEHDGDRLRLQRRGDRYWAGIAQVDADGAQWVEREVVQTTGSHHFQAFWFASGRGRELTMFPFCYRLDAQRWMPVDAAFLMPPDTRQPLGGARWNTNCVLCHTTRGQPRVEDPQAIETRALEFGIACEACHGPSAAHVTDNRDPIRRYALHLGGGADPTVANPARMSPERSAEVCGQCHAVTIARAGLGEVWARDGFTYRSGDELGATRLVVSRASADAPELRRQLTRDPAFFDTIFWPDGQVRVAGRDYHGLIASPCYRGGHGDRKLTCLSCHALHPPAGVALAEWADGQLRPGMRGDLACTQCHEAYRDRAAAGAHSRHEPGAIGCYDCHMPYTTYGLLHAIRSHTVTSPTVQESADGGRPNACNLCHLDQTLGWTALSLRDWYGTPVPELTDDQRDVSAAVLWALRGDAGQRVLIAAAMGWAPALRVSGTDWIAPVLGELLRDPYDAVRFVAERALRAQPGGVLVGYDFMAAPFAREAATTRALGDWSSARAGRCGRDLARVLVDEDGELRGEAFRRLLSQRDNRRVFLGE